MAGARPGGIYMPTEGKTYNFLHRRLEFLKEPIEVRRG